MKYNIIVACDINNGIGKNNKLPWNIPEDLKRFSKLTRGEGNNAIIMGKNTWESLPKKPLPKRDNLILSSTLDLEIGEPKNTYVKSFTDIMSLDKFCENQKYDTVWIIGGTNVYEQFIEHIRLNKIYLTRIHNSYDCDTRFPDISFLSLENIETIFIDSLKIEYMLYGKN
jgi:dihydrofolate reductase